MKAIFTTVLSLIFVITQVTAQPSVNFPLLGDTDREYHFRTAAAGGIDLELTGPGVIWDFSQIDPDSIFPEVSTQSYIDPADAPMIDQIPDVDFVLKNETNGVSDYTYLSLSGNRLEVLATFDEFDPEPLVLPEPLLLMPLPLEFGFEESTTSEFFLEFNEISDTFDLTNEYSADGYGTLLLPNNQVFENVIRLQAISSISGLADVEEGDIEGTVRLVVDQTTYIYVCDELGVPAATIEKGELTVYLVIIPNVVETPIFNVPTPVEITYYQPGETSSAEEYFLTDLRIFPNPSADFINLENLEFTSGNPIEWSIYDMTGRLVQGGEIPVLNSKYRIDLSGQKTGMYNLILTDGEKSSSYKVIKK
ncbi:MAG: T9SS C-terminal target domain-containing protein [Saprospirales bacterium]|nr:MAG: T9SS C-terminal target domain-containing protein [Saprospirales bacterium]